MITLNHLIHGVGDAYFYKSEIQYRHSCYHSARRAVEGPTYELNLYQNLQLTGNMVQE